jgi:methylase of polypeptide subunit release factors|tara:strand:- start:3548 stop:4252 length:705 start_codon:yes stop_codon:yes gene_type:complete
VVGLNIRMTVVKSKFSTYCLQQDIQGCQYPVFHSPLHGGGGPTFIKHILSKPKFLERHKDCKSVLEVCSGPGFMGWYLHKALSMESINFLDIHAPVEKDLIRTGEYNNVDFHFSLSDGFKNYTGPKVDLIVMNPPFYVTEESFTNHVKYFDLETEAQINQAKRITYDEGGKLHDNFIENFEKHLTPNGRIVFLEDGRHYDRKLLENRITHLKSEFEQFYIKDKEGDYYTLTYFM